MTTSIHSKGVGPFRLFHARLPIVDDAPPVVRVGIRALPPARDGGKVQFRVAECLDEGRVQEGDVLLVVVQGHRNRGGAENGTEPRLARLEDGLRLLSIRAVTEVRDGPPRPRGVRTEDREHVHRKDRSVSSDAIQLRPDLTGALSLGKCGNEARIARVQESSEPDPADLLLGPAEHPARGRIGGHDRPVRRRHEDGFSVVVEDH
jgi:hypothetical protein